MAVAPVPSPRRRPRVALVASLGVAAMVLTSAGGATAAVIGYSVWTDALERDLAAAADAHRAGDCATAAEGYRRVVDQRGWIEDDLAETARAGATECDGFLAVRERAEAGEWQAAIDGYEAFAADYPDSLLGDALPAARAVAELGLADDLAEQAVRSGEPDAYETALSQYVVVLTDFAGTPAAGDVEPGLAELAQAAVDVAAGGAHCDALPLLRDLAARPEAELADVAGSANDALPRSLFECGVERESAGDARGAVELLEDLADLFPDDPLVDEAEPVLVSALIERDTVGTQELEPPLEFARHEGSGALVLFSNAAPLPFEVLYTGPETGRVTLDPCPTCDPVGPDDDGGDVCASTESFETLDLASGEYRVLARFVTGEQPGGGLTGFAGTWSLAGGMDYDGGCFFIGPEDI